MAAMKWFLIGWMSGGFVMGALILIQLHRWLLTEDSNQGAGE